MKVQVRYFASLREALGAAESVELPEGATLGGRGAGGERPALGESLFHDQATSGPSALGSRDVTGSLTTLKEIANHLTREGGEMMIAAGHATLRARIGDVDGVCNLAQGCANGQYFCNITAISGVGGVEPVLVTLGRRNAEQVEVTDGLAEGDELEAAPHAPGAEAGR